MFNKILKIVKKVFGLQETVEVHECGSNKLKTGVIYYDSSKQMLLVGDNSEKGHSTYPVKVAVVADTEFTHVILKEQENK